jgi:hypothetical protein
MDGDARNTPEKVAKSVQRRISLEGRREEDIGAS